MTSFDTIEDLALQTINDYKLVKLYSQSIDDFQKWCDGFLLSAIPQFTDCAQSLALDVVERKFVSDLTIQEIKILANFFIISWWERETNDGTQIAQKLNVPSSFKVEGVSSQNMKEKQNIIDKLREENSRQINNYLSQHAMDFFNEVGL